MRKRFIPLFLAATLLSVTAAAAGIAKVTDPRFTERRNAATSLVGTLNFYVSRMAARCGALLGYDPGAYGQQVADAWQKSNARLFDSAIQYQSELVDQVAAAGDPAALDALTESIRTAVQGTGQSMVDEQLSGSGEQRVATCKQFEGNIASGALNIGPSNQFYQTLQALADEQAAAKKKK